MSLSAFVRAYMVLLLLLPLKLTERLKTYCCLQTLVMWTLHNARLFRWGLNSEHLLYFSKAPQELVWARKCFEARLTAAWFLTTTVSLLENTQLERIFHNVGPFSISTFSPWSKASLDLFLQSHFTRAQANSPRPVMTSSGPNPKVSQGTLASQTQSQSQQSQLLVGQSHNSPGSSGREQREQRSSRSSRRKGSDSSVPEEDKDRREESVGKGEDESTVNTSWMLDTHKKKVALRL